MALYSDSYVIISFPSNKPILFFAFIRFPAMVRCSES